MMRVTKAHSPSLLDKLLAHDASGKDGIALRHSVEQVKDSVARDIEMLLNAHATFQPEELAAFPQAAHSLMTLGLVDISSLSMANVNDRSRIKDAIRSALVTHDKRLSQVEVSIRATEQSLSNLTFSIHARLVLRPHVEPVIFDAVLSPASKRYEVSRSEHRSLAAQ